MKDLNCCPGAWQAARGIPIQNRAARLRKSPVSGMEPENACEKGGKYLVPGVQEHNVIGGQVILRQLSGDFFNLRRTLKDNIGGLQLVQAK